MSKRSKLFAVDYIGGKTEEVIYLNPNDIYGYGIFQFRNLEKSGFATYLTGGSYDPDSIYMVEARKAAKKLKSLTRVFLITDPKDLEKENIKKQLRLDFDAGIEVRLGNLGDIESEVTEPDFGIWDEEYVCFVSYDSKYKATQVRLSSRAIDLKIADDWKNYILDHSIKVKDLEKDIDKFLSK